MNFSDWKDVKIKDVGKVITGKTPSSKTPDHFGSLIPFVTPTDFKNYHKKIYTSERYLSQKGKYGLKDKVLPLNSVVVTCIGSDMGKVAMNKVECITNQQINSIIVNEENADGNYIYYKISNMYQYLKQLARGGTTMPIINKGTFEQIVISIPPLLEQKATAVTLSCLDDKIELNKSIDKTLEEMALAVFKSWFVDFEPFQNGEFEDSELGRIPKGWRVVDFEDVFNFQEGPGIRNWQYVTGNGTKFINIRCIQDNDLQLNTANMISDEEAKGKYSHFMLKEWDVVVSSSGTLGRYAIVRKEHLPLCLNTSVIRFSPKAEFMYFAFMLGYLTSPEFYVHLTTKACGSVQANFGPMHLRQIRLLFPDEETLLKYHKTVFPLIKKSIQVRRENQTLSTIRDALLPKLLSGEIRVTV
ncbi:MAG: hypothetical protein APF81_14290 [Desulfosporosinus sp. BRH_c37]|nr:MAG: hypothetical protein APF81_14290 [Desulfosporosinus sp. BRH_c37]